MERIGVIDIGSNSFHMAICEISGRYFNPIKIMNDSDYKAYVRLGENLKHGDFIREEKINEMLAVLTRFKQVAIFYKVNKLFCLATEALRRAGNGKQIIKRIEDQINIHVELISGEKEALKGFYGIVNSFSLKNYLMVDIGGSSTELVYIRDRKLIHSISLPVGSLNIGLMSSQSEMIDEKQFYEMENIFLKLFASVDWLKNVEIEAVIGVGGTMRTIGKYDRQIRNYPLNIQHNYQQSFQGILDIFNQLRWLTLEERLKIHELPKKRAEIFPSALVLVLSIMKYVENENLIISKFGLREGHIFEYLLQGEICEDVLERDIQQLLREQALQKEDYISVLQLLMQEMESCTDPIFKLTSLFIVKKNSELDSRRLKKFMKFILSRGVFGATHGEMIMSLLLAGYELNPKYKKILSEYELKKVEQLKYRMAL